MEHQRGHEAGKKREQPFLHGGLEAEACREMKSHSQRFPTFARLRRTEPPLMNGVRNGADRLVLTDDAVRSLQVRDRVTAGSDAVEEVAGVAPELVELVAGTVLDGPSPGCRRPGRTPR